MAITKERLEEILKNVISSVAKSCGYGNELYEELDKRFGMTANELEYLTGNPSYDDDDVPEDNEMLVEWFHALYQSEIKEVEVTIENEKLWELGYHGEEPNPHTEKHSQPHRVSRRTQTKGGRSMSNKFWEFHALTDGANNYMSGDRLRVITTDGKVHDGILWSITTNQIRIGSVFTPVSVKIKEIKTIERI